MADRNTLVHPITHLIYNSAAWSWHYTRTNNVKLETSLAGAQTAQAKKQKTNNVPIHNWQVGQMTYESEHVQIGYWHMKTKHMNKNLSNINEQHTSIMKCSGIEPRVQIYDKVWHDTCSEAKTVI